ncbi:hypothetical protein [Paenibacillus sp. P22]|uniref:hypothetical protein n=1 Tax=Paenibacillus sp. P22 TaxID=483908 RepID=UPI0012ED6D2B|nr:hypothetical protein [Paenibacillus sp. P22]
MVEPAQGEMRQQRLAEDVFEAMKLQVFIQQLPVGMFMLHSVVLPAFHRHA